MKTSNINREESKKRLLKAALQCFSEQGFKKTTIRTIAQHANMNIGFISYYFGDKAGLYRAVCSESMSELEQDFFLYSQSHLTLRQSLAGLISSFLKPMKLGKPVQQYMHLYFREMLEPNGEWAQEIDQNIRLVHASLLTVLGRHLGVKIVDDPLHRLAFSISGLALHMYVTRDVVQAIQPHLLTGPESIDIWAAQIVAQAEAMVGIEAMRRNNDVTKLH